MKIYKPLRFICLLFFLNAFAYTVGAQQMSVHIGGDVATPFDLSDVTLSTMNQAQVKTTGRDSIIHNYTGVSLYSVLSKAGAFTGDQLKGKDLAKYVLISAADGYKVVLALAEIDPGFTDRQILIVNRDNGEALAANYGPFRLIVPGDKRPARSVMRVISVEVFSAITR